MNQARAQIRRFLGLSLVAALVGCGHFRPGLAEANRATIQFSNESIDQVDVFARTTGGDPIRIGTVLAGRTETLYVPPTITGSGSNVTVIARVLAGSRAPQSGPLTIGPGDVYQIRLPADESNLVAFRTK